jgi:competence protein ComEC
MLGILAGLESSPSATTGLAILAASCLPVLVMDIIPTRIAWRWELLRGVLLQLMLFAFGILMVCARDRLNLAHHPVGTGSAGKDRWMLIPEEPPQAMATGFRTVATAWETSPGQDPKRIGRCLVYFRDSDSTRLPGIGSRIIVASPPVALSGNRNPGAFNPAAYYGSFGIRMQVSLRDGNHVVLPGREKKVAADLLFSLRNRILDVIRHYLRDPQAVGLAEALLIGYRNDLDRSLSDAYANTGVIHVIAISGLHLGMIYALLMALTRPLNRSGKKEWLQLALVIPFLWLFSLMTGASPSVVRSACMFSLLGIGRSFAGKKGDPFNTLSATAFLLLAYQPYWLADIGFQLSFTAVAGIMLFHEDAKGLIHVRNPLALQGREMIAMTLSAQTLTTPLVLFHFKRFPMLFLFTNLVAIPLSGIILMGEIALIAFSWSPPVAFGLGRALETGIGLMNEYVRRMDGLAFSVIRDVYLSTPQVCLCYAAILSAAAWRSTGSRKWRNILLLSVLAFTMLRTTDRMQRDRQRYLVIPHITGCRTLLLVNGRSSEFFTERMDRENWHKVERSMAPTQEYFHVDKRSRRLFPNGGTVWMEWEQTKVMIPDATVASGYRSTDRPPDIILLSNNARIDMEYWYRLTGCGIWVADGSNAMWKIQQWKKEAEGLNLQFHSTSLSGAFIRRIR